MFRSVLVIILVIALLWIARIVLQRLKALPGDQTNTRKTPVEQDTVKCQQCHTYVPRHDAIRQGEHHFCSQQHLEDWTQSN